MTPRTDFERRMVAEGRCISCGASLDGERRRHGTASVITECRACARSRIPHGTELFARIGRGSVGAEYRARLGYSTGEPGAEQRDDGDES